MHRLLERLNSYNLKISTKKCQWFSKEVKFLGFLVSGEGIRSNPEKVEVVKKWKAPNNKKSLLRFLGFAVFYHKFIDSLSGKAKPLYNLLKKDVPFEWTQEADNAFISLKKELGNLPTLVYPNPNLPYDLHCDGSDTGLGACLVQNGRPVAFASKTLTVAEVNYNTTEKECLAIVWALQHFHPYIYGATLNIYTDHMALKSILSTKLPRGRIARWIMALQEYQPYTIIHKKGLENVDADALSRLDQNNQEVTKASDITIDSFKTLQKADPKISLLQKSGIKLPYTWLNGILCYEDKFGKTLPVVPVGLVEVVLRHAHNAATGGHFGVEKTMGKVINIGWWSSRKEDVENWVKHCQECQKFKVRNDNATPPMQPITPTYLGEIWATDIATLPESKHGNKHVLVITEYLSKWVVAVAFPSIETSQIVQVY